MFKKIWWLLLTLNKLGESLLQPHIEASVRMRLALPKVGTWSPLGLLKLESSIIGVKTPRPEVFLIPLERSQNVNVENGLAWAIQTFVAQVMVERRARSQTANSRPLKVRNRPDPNVCRWSATHRWKDLKESYKFALDLIPIWGLSWEYELPKSRESKLGQFWDSSLGVPGLKAIRMWVSWSNTENTTWEKVVASPESGPWWVKWICVTCDLSQHQEWF